MKRNPIEEIAVRDKLIVGLKKENELQAQIIKNQKSTIKIMEDQLSEFQGLLIRS